MTSTIGAGVGGVGDGAAGIVGFDCSKSSASTLIAGTVVKAEFDCVDIENRHRSR